MAPKNLVQQTVYMTPPQYKYIKRTAKKECVTMAESIRRAIEKAMEDSK